MFDRSNLTEKQLENVKEVEDLICKPIEELMSRDAHSVNVCIHWKIAKAYNTMKHASRRCRGVNCTPGNVKRYKDRGIEFRFNGNDLQSFRMFLAEMGLPWARGHACSIDRIDSDGHYEVGNIRWANAKTQAGNR